MDLKNYWCIVSWCKSWFHNICTLITHTNVHTDGQTTLVVKSLSRLINGLFAVVLFQVKTIVTRGPMVPQTPRPLWKPPQSSLFRQITEFWFFEKINLCFGDPHETLTSFKTSYFLIKSNPVLTFWCQGLLRTIIIRWGTNPFLTMHILLIF